MDEAEWLACCEPGEMIEFLGEKVNDRKLRLFQIACCRRIWDVLSNDQRDAVCVAELYADGQVTDAKRVAGRKRINTIATDASPLEIKAGYAAFDTLGKTIFKRKPFLGCADVFGEIADKAAGAKEGAFQKAFEAEEAAEADLLRCVFGSPFRRTAFKAKWKTAAVIALAQQMYDSRDFTTMPSLADALRDAGCDNEAILSHCGGPGPHVRGCWPVDMLLGKA
jgi:hypothetical protein